MGPHVPADPLELQKLLWPDVYFYKQQREIIYSVVENDWTFVPAGNQLGKDFVAGFICLWFFLTRHPCRVVTTSAKDDHLRVLWGEIGRYVQTSRAPLDARQGGPLLVNDKDVRKVVHGQRCPLSYMVGMVAGPDSIAAMQGHHVANTGDGVPRTLFVADEASSVNDEYWKMATTWCSRALVIGNPWACSNFFYRAVKGNPGTDDRGGDLPRPVRAGEEPGSRGHVRKVIRIRATDSPNVRLGLAQRARGEEPTGQVLVPGVKSWDEYQKNLLTWDEVQKTVSLDGEFYEGAEVLLFPPEWLTRAEDLARQLRAEGLAGRRRRRARAIGCDPAEGGDRSAWVVGDELGVIEVVSKKTPNTTDVVSTTLALMYRHDVPAHMVAFDRGGGGKQHADRLRAGGHAVRTVAFGESVAPDPRRASHTPYAEKLDAREERYAYVSRRAEMYDLLSQQLDPDLNPRGFALPPWVPELRRQLAPIPRLTDREGRMRLPPKTRPASGAGSKEVSLKDLIGCSPDEADALVLMVYALLRPLPQSRAGAIT